MRWMKDNKEVVLDHTYLSVFFTQGLPKAVTYRHPGSLTEATPRMPRKAPRSSSGSHQNCPGPHQHRADPLLEREEPDLSEELTSYHLHHETRFLLGPTFPWSSLQNPNHFCGFKARFTTQGQGSTDVTPDEAASASAGAKPPKPCQFLVLAISMCPLQKSSICGMER